MARRGQGALGAWTGGANQVHSPRTLTVVVTKNGKPVAELRAHLPPRAKSPFRLHKGQSEILGDIIEPMDTGLWNALK